MKQTKILMGMPITLHIVDSQVTPADLESVFSYFTAIDNRFSTYKQNSEISKINRGILAKEKYSKDMQEVFALSDKTKQETKGYFDILHQSKFDPSGIVKGWAIQNAANMLKKKGFHNFFIDAGGDIQVAGKNQRGEPWTIGIRNPFHQEEIVKVLCIENHGVATSGTYIRGQHIYSPQRCGLDVVDIVSLTVIASNIYDADRFATAAFAMGKNGIHFIEDMKGLEGYMIDKDGMAMMTSGFDRFVKQNYG